jgi:hypothetical protein
MADIHQPYEYVQADVHIDPSGEDLPAQRYREVTLKVIELRAIRCTELRHSKRLQEQQKDRELEAKLMDKANQCVIDNASKAAEAPSISEKLSKESTPSAYGDNLTLAEALFERTSSTAPITWGNEEFLNQIQSGYKDDNLSWTNLLSTPASPSRTTSFGETTSTPMRLYVSIVIETQLPR